MLDFFELKLAFDTRGVKVTNEEINEMIEDAEVNSKLVIENNDPTSQTIRTPHVKGKVTFEEFEVMVSTKCKAKSAQHWRTILEKVPLTKGAKTAIRKYNDLNIKKNLAAAAELNNTNKQESLNDPSSITTTITTSPSTSISSTSTTPNSIIEYEYEYQNGENISMLSKSSSSNNTPPKSQDRNNHSFIPNQSNFNQRTPWLVSQTPMFHSSLNEPSYPSMMNALQQFKSPSNSLSDREQAIRNAKWSLSSLTAIALFRIVVLKI